MEQHDRPQRRERARFSRRGFLAGCLGLGLTGLLPRIARSEPPTMETRPIPSTGQPLPVVGVGTWQQFDVSSAPETLKRLENVLQNMFDRGGTVIDSSPMYGRAESVVGTLLSRMNGHDRAFLATKVWTRGRERGIDQMRRSLDRFRTDQIDLMQVHNLVDWRTHLDTLEDWKKNGTIRYTGITHYTTSALDDLASVLRERSVDFVQCAYSIGVRGAERELFPLAREKDVAVVVNRPFEGGSLFRRVRGRSLPKWAKQELGVQTWAQYFLKFILAHPAVTCVIPGTSNPQHMLENSLAGVAPLPTEEQQERMIRYWEG